MCAHCRDKLPLRSVLLRLIITQVVSLNVLPCVLLERMRLCWFSDLYSISLLFCLRCHDEPSLPAHPDEVWPQPIGSIRSKEVIFTLTLVYFNVYSDELLLRSVLLILCDNNRSSENFLVMYFVETCETILLTWTMFLVTSKTRDILQRWGFWRQKGLQFQLEMVMVWD